MGPIDRPETSLRNYHYSLRNNPEERCSSATSPRMPAITRVKLLLCLINHYFSLSRLSERRKSLISYKTSRSHMKTVHNFVPYFSKISSTNFTSDCWITRACCRAQPVEHFCPQPTTLKQSHLRPKYSPLLTFQFFCGKTPHQVIISSRRFKMMWRFHLHWLYAKIFSGLWS